MKKKELPSISFIARDMVTGLHVLVYNCVKDGIGRAGNIAEYLSLHSKRVEIEQCLLYLHIKGVIQHRVGTNGFYD